MKIAVFGYYNALNAGDDRLQHCITRLLQGNTIVFLPHYLPPPKEYLQSFDWILIGGGGLVFERVGIWADTQKWTQLCRAKIGVFGLGVNHVSPELLSELFTLIDRSEFFYVRDEKSKALLNYHPNVEVHPDLTWCFPLQECFGENNQGIALNLVPCHWKEFDPDAWVKALSDFQLHPFPFHFGKNRDYDLLKRYFGERTPHEFSLKPLMDSEFLVACRFHAIVFAMQIGKPFIAISYDDKVQRLLAEANLLECCLDMTEYARLPEKIQFIQTNYAELKQKIVAFSHLQEQQSQILRHSVENKLSVDRAPVTNPFTSLKTTAKKLLKRV